MQAKKYLKSLIMRTLLAIITFLIICIGLKNDNTYYTYYPWLFASNIDFSYIKSKVNKLVGQVILNPKTAYVSSSKLNYQKVEKYGNSYAFLTDSKYVVNNLEAGVVIYIGNKDDLGETVIIAGDDGVNYWYSNLENIVVNLYDYVAKAQIIGNTEDKILYLTFMKDNNYLSYETFI